MALTIAIEECFFQGEMERFLRAMQENSFPGIRQLLGADLGNQPLLVHELHHLRPHQVRPPPRPRRPRHTHVDHVRELPLGRRARRHGGAERLVEQGAEEVERQ
jgi:hypothetical protein